MRLILDQGARDLVRDQLRVHCPDAPVGVVEEVADLMHAEINTIVARMLEYSEEAVGFGLHYQLRDELAYEFAKIRYELTERVIEKRLGEAPSATLRADEQRVISDRPEAGSRIEKTARVLANVWAEHLRRWQRHSDWLLGRENETRRLRKLWLPPSVDSRPAVTNNHYVCQSSNRPWADEHGSVREFDRGIDGAIRFKTIGYTRWGAASFLYSQRLEDRLSAIEGDAARPYRGLVEGLPLKGHDERDWATFLIAQILRTPRSIRMITSGVATRIRSEGWGYSTQLEHLKRYYEAMFSNAQVYTSYYRAITRRAWWVASVRGSVGLLKSDEPVLLLSRGSSFVMPLSPDRCFIAGPLFSRDESPLRVGGIDIDDQQALRLNRAFAQSARESVIARPRDDTSDLRAMLASSLALHPESHRERPVPPYWGPISS